jgi:CBS domain-containing protein
MNNDPITFFENSTAKEIVKAFVEHHRVNPIPVVDKDRKVVGIVSRYDALMLFYVAPQT